jgi:hypothetical protein
MGDELGVNYTSPAVGGAAITPSDTADLSKAARALYVGGSGNVKVITIDGSVLTFTAVPGGTVLPVRVRRVFNTDTTATSLIALW